MTILRWLPIFIMMILIFQASSVPHLHVVDDSIFPVWFRMLVGQYTIKLGDEGFFSYVLSLDPDFIAHKLGHITVYGLLGIASFFASRSKKWSVFIVLLYAMSDEFHQGFVAGRSCRFWDIVLDVSAGWLAVVLYRKVLLGKKHNGHN